MCICIPHAKRIGHEDNVIVGVEAPTEGEQQPQERYGDGYQCPTEFIGIALKLVDYKLGVMFQLVDGMLNAGQIAFEPVTFVSYEKDRWPAFLLCRRHLRLRAAIDGRTRWGPDTAYPEPARCLRKAGGLA